ncbi:GNAT family N-acetyltransferase [Blastococcus xanthinilyticus]|uniref:RimJ/RimL family protein N-acetyltransferase n=1 Tax=Blastococcus xanthinilyticus TaxID=1564164 RepID=A0A5S5CW18_9ACTN|nr:GNAT family N-acetyltransferase [Blastococcus xanthinilyticus]TYP86539.1 RimJ/RimL family protein N-acetyltransferase [Blastococcus xanthinilyticus]
METPELDAAPLLLRPWGDEDADAVLAGQTQDPASLLWAGGSDLRSRDDAVARIDRMRNGDDRASWAVVDGATAALLGSVSVYSIDPQRGTAEVGYWTASGARGRGLAPRAVDAACRWVFGALAVDRIQLFHAVENTASGRVAEKAGFTFEGRLRRSHRYGDGVKHDELLWARLADDPVPRLG